ncbi:hypothetical protein [Actinomyces sp. zg296]|uniref:hypothetical protein n=1 Tax=Actinomyces sp. zg296 TaxID=2609289 RepID=UPI0013580AAD|nr:hypothetical protein [Actinomyces sp. zg296]
MNHGPDIEAIQRRLTTVTRALPLPWTYHHRQPRMSGPDWELYAAGQRPGIRAGVIEYRHGSGLDDFITHAPTDILALLDALTDTSGFNDGTTYGYRPRSAGPSMPHDPIETNDRLTAEKGN